MVAPLIGAAARMAAKKFAKKEGKKETEKPLPNSSAERKEREKDLKTLLGATASVLPVGYGVKALRDSQEEAKKREDEDEIKRETRGYKSGGSVSASKRADGCAVKGKTKGKMV